MNRIKLDCYTKYTRQMVTNGYFDMMNAINSYWIWFDHYLPSITYTIWNDWLCYLSPSQPTFSSENTHEINKNSFFLRKFVPKFKFCSWNIDAERQSLKVCIAQNSVVHLCSKTIKRCKCLIRHQLVSSWNHKEMGKNPESDLILVFQYLQHSKFKQLLSLKFPLSLGFWSSCWVLFPKYNSRCSLFNSKETLDWTVRFYDIFYVTSLNFLAIKKCEHFTQNLVGRCVCSISNVVYRFNT